MKAIELTFKEKADTFDITIMNKQIEKDMYRIIKQSLDKVNKEELKKKPEKNEAYNALCKVKDILNSPMTGLKLSIIRYCLAFSHDIILSE